MKRLLLFVPVLLIIGGLIGWKWQIAHLNKHTVPTTQADIPKAKATVTTSPPTRAELLSLTNKARSEAGQTALVEDPRLDASAQKKADDETVYKYFGHVSPHDGLHGYQYVFEQWPSCQHASENLKTNASILNTSATTVNGWLNSAPHRAALLSPTDIAVGFGVSGTNIVQHFCTT